MIAVCVVASRVPPWSHQKLASSHAFVVHNSNSSVPATNSANKLVGRTIKVNKPAKRETCFPSCLAIYTICLIRSLVNPANQENERSKAATAQFSCAVS